MVPHYITVEINSLFQSCRGRGLLYDWKQQQNWFQRLVTSLFHDFFGTWPIFLSVAFSKSHWPSSRYFWTPLVCIFKLPYLFEKPQKKFFFIDFPASPPSPPKNGSSYSVCWRKCFRLVMRRLNRGNRRALT